MLTFFIGSYTEYPIPGFGGIGHGIYTVQLDTKTGELTVLHTEKVRNPSYVAISDDSAFLYCNTELDQSDNPKLRAYRIQEDFSLEFINEQSIPGGYPCHLATFGTNILVACYVTGNVLQFPLDASGRVMPCKNNYLHSGASINKTRQEAPHAHQVAVHPNREDIYVCDLGIDILKGYHFQGSELLPNEQKDCRVTEGGGPRHMVFNAEGSLAYVLNELTGAVSVLAFKDGVLTEIDTYDSLPKDYTGQASGSAIRMHPHGTFLYAANRKSETICTFRVAGETLEAAGTCYTKGVELREFNITPDGKYLIACHQNSHDTVVYEIQEDGTFKEACRTQKVLSPACIVFPKQMIPV